ncbi:unnamed protein product [Lota lota]
MPKDDSKGVVAEADGYGLSTAFPCPAGVGVSGPSPMSQALPTHLLPVIINTPALHQLINPAVYQPQVFIRSGQ